MKIEHVKLLLNLFDGGCITHPAGVVNPNIYHLKVLDLLNSEITLNTINNTGVIELHKHSLLDVISNSNVTREVKNYTHRPLLLTRLGIVLDNKIFNYGDITYSIEQITPRTISGVTRNTSVYSPGMVRTRNTHTEVLKFFVIDKFYDILEIPNTC